MDGDGIREVYLGAFSGGEEQLVAALATSLLSEQSTPEVVSLVAEIGGMAVGHIAFSPVTVDSDGSWNGFILAPLAVKPEYQKQGVGSMLVRHGMDRLTENGVDVVLVYGDPEYYGRFGFEAGAAANYSPPYELQHPFGWQAVSLRGERSPGHGVQIACVPALRDPALW